MRYQTYFLLIVFVTGIVACNRNQLKMDEKASVKQFLSEEEQLTQTKASLGKRDKQLADSTVKLPKTTRLPEKRTMDPQNPPEIIDIIGNRSTSQKIKVSSLFGKVKYIRLDPIPETFNFLASTNYIITSNHIYAVTEKGSIFQLDQEGHLLSTICLGNMQSTSGDGRKIVTKDMIDSFEGARYVHWNNGNLCYKYENRPAQKAYIIAFDDQISGEISDQKITETAGTKNQVKGRGKILTELGKASLSYSSQTPYLLKDGCLAFVQRGKQVGKVADFIDVVSYAGDTLCIFTDYDPVGNFTHRSEFRGADEGNAYYSGKALFLRQAYNDTVFQLIPPNQLVPKYILNFGNLKIPSSREGVDPKISLANKLIPQSFLETNQYIFITYTKDYASPNTAKEGILKYSRLIYNKKSGSLTPIYIDEAPFIPGGKLTSPSAPEINIENDLDGMPFKWPMFVTTNGQPFSAFSGEELLKIKNRDIPVNNIRENDIIIAIYSNN